MWGDFMLNEWSSEVENAKFDILGSNYPKVQVGVPIIFLAILRRWGKFMVNIQVDVLMTFFNFYHFA